MAISIALSLASMAVVIYLTYSPGVFEHLKLKRLPGLILAVFVTFLKVYLTAEKIRFLADKTISRMASIRITLTWDFASAITPSTIGGAPVAAYAMTREGIKLGKSSALMLYSVLLDQFLYALAVPVLLVSSIYFNVIPDEIGTVGTVSMILLYAGFLSYGTILTYSVLINPSVLKIIVSNLFKFWFLKKYNAKATEVAQNIEKCSIQLQQKPFMFMVKAFLLTAITWLTKVSLPVIVVLSLLPADEILLTLRSLAMNLAFLVIPTPGGSGGVEGLFALFLGSLITRSGFIGLAVFAWRIITYYSSIGLGIFAMMWYVNRTVSKKFDIEI